MLGNERRYFVVLDEINNTWRILDSRHPSLAGKDLSEDLPDDSPAVIILTEGMFEVLLEEAQSKGLLPKGVTSNALEENKKTMEENSRLSKETEELRDIILDLKGQVEKTYNPTRHAIDALLKITSMEQVSRQTERE